MSKVIFKKTTHGERPVSKRARAPAPASPLPGSAFPRDMRPSFCRFVRHMLQATAARLVTSSRVTTPTRKRFMKLVGSLDWNGSSEEARNAVEETLSFLIRLQRAHEKAGDEPFRDGDDKEIFFRNIHLARNYLNKLLNMLVGSPSYTLVKEDISLSRIIGDTVPLVEANGVTEEACSFEEFAGFTVGEMAKFMKKNPRHPATIFVRKNRMTLDELAAHVERKRKKAACRKPFRVDYAHATGTDTLNVDQIDVFLLFENLLSNAMRAGATEVKITSTKSLLRPEMAQISVEDNGRGFGKRQLRKAKSGEPFSTKKRGDGEVNGVGLIHCRSIVGHHGGEFSIESREGEGAKVSFMLPLSKQG